MAKIWFLVIIFLLSTICNDEISEEIEKELEILDIESETAQSNIVRTIGDQVHIDLCPAKCHYNGVCQRVFHRESKNLEEYNYNEKFICVCKEFFIGATCNQCKTDHFGKECELCPIDEGKVCAGNGVCDDGIKGTGKCYCETPDLLPVNNCRKVILDTGHHKENVVQSLGLSFLFLLMLACILLMYMYKKLKYLHIIPESIVAIIIGLIFGSIIKSSFENQDLINILSFEPHAFFLILLPPIMYDAGFTLNKANFFANIVPIASFAIFGTIIATIVFSLTIFFPGFLYNLYPLSLGECLQFGSLISAVDPVATISIFKNFGVNKNIFFLVFGESVLNDAVSIALNHSFAVLTQTEFSGGQLIQMGIKFFIIFFGSIAFGLIMGIIVSLMLKYIQFDNDQFIELSFFFFFSYIPYILSEAIGLSGILSILITGMVMGHYAKYSLSPISRVTVENILQVISSIAEIFIFAYLGLSFPLISVKTPPALVLMGTFGLLFSRAISIFGISLLVNKITKEKICFSSQIIVWFSGLRGAVAFYLAINTTSENQEEILSSTLWLILISILVLGSLTPLVLNILDRIFPYDKIMCVEDTEEEELLAPRALGILSPENIDASDSDTGGILSKREITDSELLVSRFSYFDVKFFRTYFRKRLWHKYEKGFKDIMEYNKEMIKYRKRKIAQMRSNEARSDGRLSEQRLGPAGSSITDQRRKAENVISRQERLHYSDESGI
ncbi:unnamed protein product [Moneuplotes crassus]|uniref:Sodium/hydrogen exchanger n=1 Tax=Euplotes crassus TaxID=5936 RepID=A0AAD1YBB2_EUPCR|nr:unnamed protein product [Moneuplotes crassus]